MKLTHCLLAITLVTSMTTIGQETTTTTTTTKTTRTTSSGEQYGKTLNIGLGVGYYGYIGNAVPMILLNYEFDVAKNFTLAPFIGIYSYSRQYYWGNKDNPYRYYAYRETVIPVGVKGTYYFDQLVKANSKWDFYIAGSLGFAFVNSTWENGYYGNKGVYGNARPLYLDIHLGAEYKFNDNLGAFLDLSSGVSTLGLAIH